jgi:hypothetical protein
MTKKYIIIFNIFCLFVALYSLYQYYHPTLSIFYPPSFYSYLVHLYLPLSLLFFVIFKPKWITKTSNLIVFSIFFLILPLGELSSVFTWDEPIIQSLSRYSFYSFDFVILAINFYFIHLLGKKNKISQ